MVNESAQTSVAVMMTVQKIGNVDPSPIPDRIPFSSAWPNDEYNASHATTTAIVAVETTGVFLSAVPSAALATVPRKIVLKATPVPMWTSKETICASVFDKAPGPGIG